MLFVFRIACNGTMITKKMLRERQFQVAKCLGKSVNSKLRDAVETCNVSLMQFLIPLGADVNDIRKGIMPIIKAMRKNNVDIVKILVQNGSNLEYEHPTEGAEGDQKPIYCAIAEGRNLDIIKVLVEGGCNINHIQKGRYPASPICMAIARCREDIFDYLLQNKADIDNIICSELSPLMCAFQTLDIARKNDEKGLDILIGALNAFTFGLIGAYMVNTDPSAGPFYRGNINRCTLVSNMLHTLLRTASAAERLINFQYIFRKCDMKTSGICHDILRHTFIKNETTIKDFLTAFNSNAHGEKILTNKCDTKEFLHLFSQVCVFHRMQNVFIKEIVNGGIDVKTPCNTLLEFFSQPMDLESLCCQCIRQNLTYTNLWGQVDKLPLPFRLKDRIKLKCY